MRIFRKSLKILGIVLLSVIGLVVLVMAALYIPPVQDAIFKKVVAALNGGDGGMHVDYKSLRLKFPAHVVADSVEMRLPGEIEAQVGRLDVPVNLLPLFALDISSDNIDIEDIRFRLGTPDSALYLLAAVDTLAVEKLSVGLRSMKIDVGKGDVSGVDVTLLIGEDTVPKVDTAKVAGRQFVINARGLAMHRVNYMMSIAPTIDTIAARIDDVKLLQGVVDLNEHRIEAADFDVDGVEAEYIYSLIPQTEQKKPESKAPEEPADSVPWQINVENIALTGSRALYALKDAEPQPGLDMNYIEARDILIEVDSFYNCRQDIRVPLKKFRATERCGLQLRASGTFSIDGSVMRADKFRFELPGSTLDATALMGLPSERYPRQADCPVKIDLNAAVAPADVAAMLPSLSPILDAIPRATPLLATAAVSGTMDNIDLRRFSLELPRLMRVSATGYAAGFMGGEMKDLSANMTLHGSLMNADLIKPNVVEAKLGKGVKIAPFTIDGNAKFRRGNGTANLTVRSGEGDMALDGNVNFNSEAYDADFITHAFPLQAFLPGIGVADLSARVSAKGQSFMPLAKGASLTADVAVDSVYYNKVLFHHIDIKANIAENDAILIAQAGMPDVDFNIMATGNVVGPDYSWMLNADIKQLQLEPIGFSKTPNGGSVRLNGNIDFNPDSLFVNSHFDFPLVNWTLDDRNITTRSLELSFDADRSGTVLDLTDRDLLLQLSSRQSLDSIMRQIPHIQTAVDSCLKIPALEVDYLQSTLPQFDFELAARKKNVIAEWMVARGDYFDSLGVRLSNHERLRLDALMKNYRTPSYIVDSLRFDLLQRHDSLAYRAHLANSPMSPGDWADVKLWGRMGGNELVARFLQKNHDKETGFRFGLDARYADSTLIVSFEPEHPVINYSAWTLNAENFISVNVPKKHIDANLSLSRDNSLLRLYTDHLEGSDDQEQINLVVKNIEIQDWISLNPFATPMKGVLSGRVALSHQGNVINGDGNISLENYYYGRQLVGNFDVGVDVSTTPGGFIHAQANLDVNSRRVLDVYGVLNDTTAVNPFFLKVDIDSLPLPVVNPFLHDAGVSLTGNLNGNMLVTGEPAKPVFNGSVNFINTGIKVGMLGTTYSLSNNAIPIDTGIVRFNRYTITGVNSNPLFIDGTVNMHDLFNPRFSLAFTANDMQIIGTDRARGGAELYGKGFIDLDATVRGSMKFMNIKANATLLNNTNVTYVLVGGAESALTSRSNSSLVKFVNFSDTSMVASADSLKPTGMLMNIGALLKIDRGATISVDLSTDGKNKVQLQPVGNLDYTRDVLGAQHVTGRIDIDGGFARYTPPLMSEKLFNFQDGSYVAFNGDMMNPLLNIKAVDRVRANVTQEGANSRLINFDVALNVTGSLNNMDVGFDMSTPDDVTVENELESMSPSQRASKAMNLLLTNTYTGPGTTADANMGSNVLYSFLSSTLNSWAANNIKAVDLSFGVNQYENTTDGVSSQATSYSYKVSKSLFNDRFKFNVGGNYTTDANADENLTQNLISDISIEYMLNKNGSMYVKIFRHAGFESILEGEVIQTGVGFTYRRRLDSLRQMFWFMLPKRYRYGYAQPAETPQDSVPPLGELPHTMSKK